MVANGQQLTSTVTTATSVHSPNLNPIDTVFARFEHLRPTECANYFRNSGYANPERIMPFFVRLTHDRRFVGATPRMSATG
jgi:hypothetical protein